MDEMRLEIVNLNIAHYERLLETETNEERVQTVRSLLAEAHEESLRLTKAMSLGERRSLVDANGGNPFAPPREGHRLRMKAAEYRTMMGSSRDDATRATYLYIARSYEVLAERAEGIMGDRRDG